MYGQTEAMQSADVDARTATVVVPSALVGFAGGRSHISVELTEGSPEGPRSPLTAVLDELRREVPALERRIRDERGRVRGHVNIYVDGVDIRELGGVGTVIVPGATVHIIAAVSGG
jgi:molybdopterin converting factor small subunit